VYKLDINLGILQLLMAKSAL